MEHNEWLQQLYEIRESWVPVYNRSTFFAGMNTTGRSEGTNAFFDDFVTSTINLREFVVKYEQALQKIVANESCEDFISEHEGKCECQNFEFVGIICRHIMKVFVPQDIDTIPLHYILPRWRKWENKFRVMDSEALVKNDGK